MSRDLATVLRTVPFGWHVVDVWVEDDFGSSSHRVEQDAIIYLDELRLQREEDLRLVITTSHVRALGKRIAVWVVAVIARDDAPPVDFPEPAE